MYILQCTHHTEYFSASMQGTRKYQSTKQCHDVQINKLQKVQMELNGKNAYCIMDCRIRHEKMPRNKIRFFSSCSIKVGQDLDLLFWPNRVGSRQPPLEVRSKVPECSKDKKDAKAWQRLNTEHYTIFIKDFLTFSFFKTILKFEQVGCVSFVFKFYFAPKEEHYRKSV